MLADDNCDIKCHNKRSLYKFIYGVDLCIILKALNTMLIDSKYGISGHCDKSDKGLHQSKPVLALTGFGCGAQNMLSYSMPKTAQYGSCRWIFLPHCLMPNLASAGVKIRLFNTTQFSITFGVKRRYQSASNSPNVIWYHWGLRSHFNFWLICQELYFVQVFSNGWKFNYF